MKPILIICLLWPLLGVSQSPHCYPRVNYKVDSVRNSASGGGIIYLKPIKGLGINSGYMPRTDTLKGLGDSTIKTSFGRENLLDSLPKMDSVPGWIYTGGYSLRAIRTNQIDTLAAYILISLKPNNYDTWTRVVSGFVIRSRWDHALKGYLDRNKKPLHENYIVWQHQLSGEWIFYY